MHDPASVLENETHKLLWDFEIQTDPLISARRPDLIIINNKKKLNRKVMVIPIVIDGLGTVTKGLVEGLEDLEIRGRVETIQTYSIVEMSQNTEISPGDLRDLLSFKFL